MLKTLTDKQESARWVRGEQARGFLPRDPQGPRPPTLAPARGAGRRPLAVRAGAVAGLQAQGVG